MIRPFFRAVALVAVAVGTASCAGRPSGPPASPTERARRDGPESRDGEVVGRWLLAELIAPGGTTEGALRARKRLDELGSKGMLASLGRGFDDAAHGRMRAAGEEYLKAAEAARGSNDRLAPLAAWFAMNHLLALDGTTPATWRAAKPWALDALDSPGSLGWRARGELVEWWSRHAFEDAEANLLERTAARYGCVRSIRLAGPFGHGAAVDRVTHFDAERPGPWPARWAADPLRAQAPRVLRTERHGCTVRTEEPAGAGMFYAETFLETPVERELIIAVQGAVAVWIDDHEVLTRDSRVWGVWPKFGVRVRLAAGRHRVLARVPDPETSVRVMKADGAPAEITASAAGDGTYQATAPAVGADPNVLDRYLAGGQAHVPADDLEAFFAAYLAAVEGQHDVASVLVERLVADQETATPIALTTAASFAEKDPIFPDGDAHDLGRLLREKAAGKDAKMYFPRLWLLGDKAEKSAPEAAREVRALIDEFPEVPEIPRFLASIYARLGWRAERTQTIKALLERFPEDRGALESAIVVYEEGGKLAEADALAKRLVATYPDSEIELDRALARHDYDAALTELRRLGERRPDRRDIADRIAGLLVRAGKTTDPLPTLERLVKRTPRDAAARLSLADARFAAGDKSALRTALAAAIQSGAPDVELRGAIELVEGMTELEPYRIDGRKVIADYEKDPQPLDGTAARVLDYSTLWIHPDGSSRMLEHELVRVQSQEAIGKLAEQRIPPGALVLRARVIKKDGRVLEPERVEGKPTVTMPHLEIGDYIETENITAQEGDGEGGKRYLGPHWFFREADIAYWRSEFIVIAPKERVLQLETTGAVPEPTISTVGPLSVRRWRVDRSPAAPVEPSSVPVQEFLPSVRVGWGLTEAGQLARMLDATFDDLPRDPRLVRIATRIVGDTPASDVRERARRLYRWLLANVEDGREADGRRVIIGKSGNRAAAFLYLARAMGLPVELGVVRDRLRPREEGPISSALGFSAIALRLDTGTAPLWFTVGDRYAPFGFLPAELRGQPAVRLIPSLPRETTAAAGSLDGIVYEGTAELRSDGSAVLELDQRFVGRVGIGVRGSVEQLAEEQLKNLVESRLLARALPGARLVSLALLDKDDLDKPLTFHMKVEVSDFARRRGNSLALKPPLTMKIAGITALETRQTPMLLPEATHTEVRLAIKLPKGATVVTPLEGREIMDGDRLARVADATLADGVLRIDRLLDIPAGRVQVEEYAAFRTFTIATDEATSREILIQLP